MIDDDDWLNFHFAAKEIKAKLGVSLGKAQAMLRQLCASPGEVRCRKQPYILVNQGTVNEEPAGQGPPELIEPSEWREHEIDLMTDDLGCWYFVDVRESDFRYWLNQQKATLEQGKQPLVIKHLTKRFSGQRVPDPAHCVRKDLLAELRKLDPILAQLDIKTLMRAINKYNSSLPADGKR
jgi:hypothetical protein